MKRFFLDIETLPARPQLWDRLPARIREDLAARVRKGDTPREKLQEAHRRTSLLGDLGRILCIGLIVEDDQTEAQMVLGWDEEAKRFREDEAALLREFWEALRQFDRAHDLLVGHNVLEFDLRFIYQRSVVHAVQPSIALDFRRYSSQPVFDTMQEWGKWGRKEQVSLDRLAQALGLASTKTEEMSGDKVYDSYREGRHQLIRDYCLADVVLTREVYRRMTFAR